MNTGTEVILNLIIEQETNTGMYWGRVTYNDHLIVAVAPTIKELKNKIQESLSVHSHLARGEYLLYEMRG
jgi:hypothetical protein